ncbi:MAG: hypothetical protein ACMVO5_12280 [Polymorphobacter sp.]|uniref:hypothetical protein n=1 Tax=Polymorphobacter sp. TaxID=1909290 RepID=UPI003A8B13EF
MIKPFLLFGALALAVPALAQPYETPRSDARLAADEARNARQAVRIDKGVESGRLNPNEAAHLTRRNERTTAATAHLASDGFYSRKDAARVDRRQDTTSRRTWRAGTNRR